VVWRATGWLVEQRWVPWYDAMAIHVSCRQLWLSHNQLSGSIPSPVGNAALGSVRRVTRGVCVSGFVFLWVRCGVRGLMCGMPCMRSPLR
jgi:hypothetical protein